MKQSIWPKLFVIDRYPKPPKKKNSTGQAGNSNKNNQLANQAAKANNKGKQQTI